MAVNKKVLFFKVVFPRQSQSTVCLAYLFLTVANEYFLMRAQASGSRRLLSWGVSKAVCDQQMSFFRLGNNQLGLPLKDPLKYPSVAKAGCENLSWTYNQCASIRNGCSAFSCVAQDILASRNSRAKLALTKEEKEPMWPLQLTKLDTIFPQVRKTSRGTFINVDPPLPDDIVPTSYKLTIRPILDPNDVTGEQWTAPGKVEIDITCVTSTMKIVIKRHAKVVLEEDTIQVTETGSKSGIIPVTSKTYNTTNTFYTINVGTKLVQGETYKLSISFIAPIDTYRVSEGLYRAEYMGENGTEYRLALTQFEQIAARQMFPCFDEPRWKTPFTVSIGYKNGIYNALGNSPAEVAAEADPTINYTRVDLARFENKLLMCFCFVNLECGNIMVMVLLCIFFSLAGWVWDHLKETVPMPTYLLAIVVSNFAFVEAPASIYEKPVRLYAEPRYIAKGWGVASAKEAAILMARHQKKYVHPYEMPKMDLVAIPNPFFQYGGMENWGIVTMSENFLLFNQEEQSWAEKYDCTSTLSHELAHQWFGNLVTCRTWDYLWLNEGFATYVTSYGIEDIAPEFNERHGRLQTAQKAMKSELNFNSPPVVSPTAPLDVYYLKGASIIRMMEGFLGEETLTAGLVNYLKAFAYKATVQDELFEHLTTSAVQDGKLPPGKTVKDIMDTWTLQPGFPLIRVSKLGASQIQITQERFQNKLNGTANSQQQELYEVPIATATRDSAIFSNYTPTIWLSKSAASTTLSHDTSKWIFVNPDCMGYYRVLYDKDLIQLIMDQLKVNRNAISAISRSQLFQDYFNFYENGYISLEEALNVTRFLKSDKDTEDDFSVWNALLEQLTTPLGAFQAFSSGPKHSLAEYLKPKIEDALRKIGSVPKPEDKGTLVLFKAKLLDWACAFESDICFKYAQETMTAWRQNNKKNPFFPDTQSVMYCASVAMGGQPVVDFLVTKFAQAPEGTYYAPKNRILKALGCARDPDVINSLLQDVMNKSSVIGQSGEWSLLVFRAVAANPIGRPILLQFLDDNVDRINVFFQNSKQGIYYTLAAYYYTETELQKFIEVIKRNKELDVWIERLTSVTEQNIKWMKSNYAMYDTWFKSHSGDDPEAEC